MSVRALDENGDWTFGQSKANYLAGVDEVKQNVATRIKSFQNDWFLDVKAGIDWFTLLGNPGTKETILDEIARIVRGTKGVRQLESLDIVYINERDAQISLTINTIYDKSFSDTMGVTLS
jgi:hypothetical protein